MKIIILKNNVYDTDTLDRGIVLAQQWAQTIGLDLQFASKEITRQFTSVPFSNSTNSNGYLVNSLEIFQEALRLGYTFNNT